MHGGTAKPAGGSGKLVGGLHDGAEQTPGHGKKARDPRTEVRADPVRLVSEDLHKAPNCGTGFVSHFVPPPLWVGAMVAHMLIAPMNGRALAAGAPAWRIAPAGRPPVVAIGVLRTPALMPVLHWAIRPRMARTVGAAGFRSW